jgi:hypothetical protein
MQPKTDGRAAACLFWVNRVDLPARQPLPVYPLTADVRSKVGFRR